MAVLYWRGNGSTGGTGGDWNTAVNWYTPFVQGVTGGSSFTVLIPAGRTPWANDIVNIHNVLPYPITGTTTAFTPILANCVTGGMAVTGLTYNWVGAASGVSYGPLASLNVNIETEPATGYTYTHFSFNPANSIALFWKNASSYLQNMSWMTGSSASPLYWTMGFYGVLNGGFTASNHNIINTHVSGSTSDANYSYNRIDLSLKGKLGKSYVTQSQNSYFGDITVASSSTVNTMEVRGQPNLVLLPIGTTCSVLWIQPSNLIAGITTKIQVECTVGLTTNEFSSASTNNYGSFQGIKFNKSSPYVEGANPYSVFIGYPLGSTASSSGSVLYYNIWEENVSNIRGGEANIQIQGSCFINDMLLEDSAMMISSECNADDTIKIKKGELRGLSSLDLRKPIPFDGFTLGVPMILGSFAATSAGQTGAVGVLLSSRDCTFIPHPSSTISF